MTTWLSDHIGLVVSLAIPWLIVVIAFFILAAVCEGATVRAAAEHDAERALGLRLAWRMGIQTMWVIVSAAAPPITVVAALIILPFSLLIAGFFSAQGSTYWTLAFRRLDLDYAPAYGYPAAPPAATQ